MLLCGTLAVLLEICILVLFTFTLATATPTDPLQGLALASHRFVQDSSTTTSHNNSLFARANCHVDPYQAPEIIDQTFPPYDEVEASLYRYRQQQSVNLGSWFVHENWMTPSMFDCAAGKKAAEIDIAMGWGTVANARAKLERHWDTFVTEDDFQYLESVGINTVRLPIGYWNLGPDFTKGTAFEGVGEVYQNSWPRVVRAINQAGRHGIGVLVDLHGAVGSQNGQAHSGVSDGKTKLFDDQGNIDRTITVLTFLAKQLVRVNNVVGIQLLNEPKDVASLTSFYNKAIDIMRSTSPEAKMFPLYIHDGFNLGQFSRYIAGREDFVVQDHHSYFVFTQSDKSKTPAEHISRIRGAISDDLNKASNRQRRNLVVDEWSCALTPEALSKAKSGAQVQKDFCTSQMEVYGKVTAGWSFWAYKKEDCQKDASWCFKAAVGKNLPGVFFSYPGGNRSAPASVAQSNNDSTATIQPSPRSDETNYSTGKFHRVRSFHKLHSRIIHTTSSVKKRDGARDANQKGHEDGVEAARQFASFGMSKLGFTKQYIHDNVVRLGPAVVNPSNEGDYTDGFMKGLLEGESTVAGAL